jgi:hypothetical protein
VPLFNEQEDLLISLPESVDFIHTAVEAGGRVLVWSAAVSRISKKSSRAHIVS